MNTSESFLGSKDWSIFLWLLCFQAKNQPLQTFLAWVYVNKNQNDNSEIITFHCIPTLNTFAYVEYTSIQVTGLFTESGWVNTKIGLWWFGLCLPVMYLHMYFNSLMYSQYWIPIWITYLKHLNTKINISDAEKLNLKVLKRPRSYRGHVNRINCGVFNSPKNNAKMSPISAKALSKKWTN